MENHRKIKRLIIGIISVFLVGSFIWSCTNTSSDNGKEVKKEVKFDKDTKKCISCHKDHNQGESIIKQWENSTHAQMGVGCLSCHKANTDDVDAYEHEGYTISTIVTPNDCAVCHPNESKEFQHSYHADAGMIMGSLDNVLAEVVEGHVAFNDGSNPAAAAGCHQCHGSKIEVLKDDDGNALKDSAGIVKYDPKTWPNTGIGRINLDGSKGSCSACHSRHDFSRELARNPENCGKCHQGPDHPQIEIYQLSKHGIAFYAHKDKMNLDSKSWIVGKDYSAAPTCATCHMSATEDMPITHDVGNRISWTLRPKVSEKKDAALIAKYKKLGKELPADFLSWEQRRDNMKNVCKNCHENSVIEGHYIQFDNEVNLYNEKFGKPALKIMKLLKSTGLITATNFDEPVEWDYFLMWHHEGRRARHGASMMAPDYTQWHGNFEVAERWYTKIVPEIKEIIAKAKRTGKSKQAIEVENALNEILNSDMHKWYVGKMSSEEVQKRKESAAKYRERYSNE
ncbi:MAG: hydroxylamine oxidoreductase [Bacteroidetes bacterium]|nr:MAG: hydroxylamine oxidoreductase [Bacteroidota bacterium]